MPSPQTIQLAEKTYLATHSSQDNGLTWTRTDGGPENILRLASGPDGALYATSVHAVSKFSSGLWTDITPKIGDKSGGFNGISINPRNASDLVCISPGSSLNLYRSLDGGSSWTLKKYVVKDTPPWYSGGMKQIQQAAGLVFDPVVSGRVWLTDWYATYHTDNIDSDPITLTATERGHEELVVFDLLAPISGVPLISGAADDDGFVHSSLTDYPRGFGSYYNGDGPSFGDTTQIAECLSSPSRLVRVSSNRWNQVGGVTVSTDGGMSWTPVSGWNTQIKPLRVAMSATDPNNFVVVPLGGGQTSATNDGGKTFTRSSGLPLGLLSGDVWNWQFPLVADGKLGGVYYVFASGTVYKSTDGGATFTVAAKGLPASYEALVTVPGSAGDVWADFGDSGLYHSTDGAVSFSKLSTVKTAKLFAVGKRAPSGDYASLYLYGSLADGRSGIFRSIDEGLSWIEIGDPNVPIGDTPNCMAGSLQTFGLVFIGTNGRGIYYGKPD